MQVSNNSLNPLGTAVASSATPVTTATTSATSTASASGTSGTSGTSDTVTLSEEARAKLAAEQTETNTSVSTLGSGWGNEPPL